MKNGNTISARLPPEIVYGIDEFQRKHNLAFRTEALIEIVKVACSAVGIDLSDIPADPALPTQATEEKAPGETEPYQWLCPLTGRMGDYQRCEHRIKTSSCTLLTACKAIPKSQWSNVFPGEEPREEEAPEEEEAKEEPVTPTQATQKPIVVNEHKETEAQKEEPEDKPEEKPISTPPEPSVIEETPKDQPPETVGDPDPLVQQAAYIRTQRERSKKKPEGQQTLGPEKECQA